MSSLVVQPVTLTGRVVRLEPLSLAHVPDLAVAGAHPDIWRFIPYPPCATEADMRAWVEDILVRQARGTDVPFAVIHLGTGRAVGATRYMDIQPANQALEIGGTWYAPEVQRTAVNTESKYLLLGHAFERLGCARVQFKTDLRNERSQRAIERLGAVREGVLRDHVVMPDGYRRSSVYYSILAAEWPAVKAGLEQKLRT
jgi:RimJ/RimL family protein N-acetyltransferase